MKQQQTTTESRSLEELYNLNNIYIANNPTCIIDIIVTSGINKMIVNGCLKWLRKMGNNVAYDMLRGSQPELRDDLNAICTSAIYSHIDNIELKQTEYITKVASGADVGTCVWSEVSKSGYQLVFTDCEWKDKKTKVTNHVKEICKSAPDKYRIITNDLGLEVLQAYVSPSFSDIMHQIQNEIASLKRSWERQTPIIEYYVSDNENTPIEITDNASGWRKVADTDKLLQMDCYKRFLSLLLPWEQSLVNYIALGGKMITWCNDYADGLHQVDTSKIPKMSYRQVKYAMHNHIADCYKKSL